MSSKGFIYKVRRRLQVLALKMTSPETMSRIYFRIIMKENLNLENPRTLNEKIQWLKLYYCPYNTQVIECADKYAVREYVKQKGLGEYLNELIYVWDRSEQVDLKNLPNSFVLKCTHGCGYNIICHNKADMLEEKIKQQLALWMAEDFSLFNAEPHYAKINRKIICEKYLGKNLIDYKFFCFSGRVEFMYIAQGFGDGINERIAFFDRSGRAIPVKRCDYPVYLDAKLPNTFREMIKISENLSKEFPFVRIDLFEVEGKIFFSEMTFTPGGGLMRIDPSYYDEQWGRLLTLSGDKSI